VNSSLKPGKSRSRFYRGMTSGTSRIVRRRRSRERVGDGKKRALIITFGIRINLREIGLTCRGRTLGAQPAPQKENLGKKLQLRVAGFGKYIAKVSTDAGVVTRKEAELPSRKRESKCQSDR